MADPNASPDVLYLTRVCLSMIEEPALAPTMAFVVDHRNPHRGYAIGAIGGMHYLGIRGAPPVPVLVRSLDDLDEEVAANAAAALGTFVHESAVCVPALTNSLRDSRGSVRVGAALGLGGLGESALPAIPALIKALNDPDQTVRTEATNALQQIAPEALEKALGH